MSTQPSLNGYASAHPRRPRRYFARNLPVFYLFYGASGFLIWFPIWIVYLQDLRGMSLSQIATMESFFWLTIVIAEVPTGAIADRWGRRTSLLLGGVGFTAASVAFAFSADYIMLMISYLIMAVSMTLYSGAGHALLFDSLRQIGRTNEYETHVGRSEAAAFGAMLAATLLGGPIAAAVGYQWTILLGAAVMAGAAVIAFFLREPPRTEAEIETAASANGAARSAAPAAHSAGGVLRNMFAGAEIVWRRKTLLWIILFAALIHAVAEMPEFLLQPFVRAQGIDPRSGVDSGLAFSALLVPPLAGMVVGSLIAAWAASRFGERRALPRIFLTAALLFIPLLAFNSLWVIAAVGLIAVIRGMLRPIATGYINRRILSDQRATVLSMFELSVGLIMALIIGPIGSAADVFSYQTAFGLCLATLLIGGGLFGMIWRRAHRREQARSAFALHAVAAPQANAQATMPRSRSPVTAAASSPSKANSGSVS